MTETDWLEATDPRPLLRFAAGPGELRHFAVACVRALGVCGRRATAAPTEGGVTHLWPEVLDTADRMASGSATPEAVAALVGELLRFVGGMTIGKHPDVEVVCDVQSLLLSQRFTRRSAENVALFGCGGVPSVPTGRVADIWDYMEPDDPPEDHLPIEAIRRERMALQAAFARDIFGNPFRPIRFDPSWLTSDVLAVARGIYADNDFDRIPILADALQEAGCDHEDILSHCRSDGLHVRGCWVVEYVLGRWAPASARLLRLAGITDKFVGQAWSFLGPFEVGRQSGRFLANDQHTSLSRLHAAVYHDEAGWWVADRGSTNGTWLNGTRIDDQLAVPIRSGDIIQFANITLRVETAALGGGAVQSAPQSGAWSPASEG